MNELGTAFTHVIVLFDKSHHFITADENARLAVVGNGVRVSFNGFTLNTSAISQILTVEDFYIAYPDQRPSHLEEFKPPKEEYIPADKQAERSERALRGLLAGMMFYQENHGTNAVLDSMLVPKMKKYETLYGKKMELTDADRNRCVASFTEPDQWGQPKLPCQKCLDGRWTHPNHSASVDVVTAFS